MGLSWGCGQLPGWRPRELKPVYHHGRVLFHSWGWNSSLLRPPKTSQGALLPAGTWSLHEATSACVRRFRYCRSICFTEGEEERQQQLCRSLTRITMKMWFCCKRWEGRWFPGIFLLEKLAECRRERQLLRCCWGKIHTRMHMHFWCIFRCTKLRCFQVKMRLLIVIHNSILPQISLFLNRRSEVPHAQTRNTLRWEEKTEWWNKRQNKTKKQKWPRNDGKQQRRETSAAANKGGKRWWHVWVTASSSSLRSRMWDSLNRQAWLFLIATCGVNLRMRFSSNAKKNSSEDFSFPSLSSSGTSTAFECRAPPTNSPIRWGKAKHRLDSTPSLQKRRASYRCLRIRPLIKSPHEHLFFIHPFDSFGQITCLIGQTRGPDSEDIWPNLNQRGEGNPRGLRVKGFRPTQREEWIWKQLTKRVWILSFMEERLFFNLGIIIPACRRSSYVQTFRPWCETVAWCREKSFWLGFSVYTSRLRRTIAAPIYTSYLWKFLRLQTICGQMLACYC